MARKLKGLRRKNDGWEAYIRIHGHLYTQRFPRETPVETLRAWHAQQRDRYGAGRRGSPGSFAADVEEYLRRRTAMPTYKQKAAHLALWLEALGYDRSRSSITATEIDAVLQQWLVTPTQPAPGEKGRPSGPDGLAPATVRKRRRTLQSLFVTLDGPHAPNPVKSSTNPLEPKPEARGLDYGTIARILDAMPAWRSARPGAVRLPALAKLRATVIAYTGLPPGLLGRIRAMDVSFEGTGTVRVSPRRKGQGVAACTLPLTPLGCAAFQAFHAANAYGPFNVQTLNVSFQRACRHVGLDPTTVTLYDLRHSFGRQLYRETKDLATVARFLLHSEGSPVTARYAKGANEAVDAAAAAGFLAGVSVPKAVQAVQSVGQKLARGRKSRKPKHLRVAI
jgi:integrase